MAKKNKGKKKAAVAKTRKGSLGDIFGFAVTAVIRALAVAGASNAHVRAIVKKKGITMPDHSVDVQCGLGKTEVRPAAALTAEQVNELLTCVEEPARNGHAESAAKGKAKAKAKGKAKAKRKAKEQTTGAQVLDETSQEEEPARVHSAEEKA